MPEQPYARFGLAIVRLTIGAMFVGVFFENLGKGLYTPSGYAGLINYYIQHDHAPAIWKAIMATAASHAAMAAPLQGMTEISLGVLLVARSSDATCRTCRVWVTREPVGVGVGHVVDLGTAGSYAGSAWDRSGSRGPDVGG